MIMKLWDEKIESLIDDSDNDNNNDKTQQQPQRSQ